MKIETNLYLICDMYFSSVIENSYTSSAVNQRNCANVFSFIEEAGFTPDVLLYRQVKQNHKNKL